MQRHDPSPSNVVALETEPERRWREFLEARDRAWNSRSISDGIASGRAYRAPSKPSLGRI
jgi:hypothetical protein